MSVPVPADFLARPITLGSLVPFGAVAVADQLGRGGRPRIIPAEAVRPLADGLRRLASLAEIVVDGGTDREKLAALLDELERERLRLVHTYGGSLDVRHLHGMAEDADGLPVVVPLRRPGGAGGSR